MKSEILFGGMLLTGDGIRPDPAKVEPLQHNEAHKSKEDSISFLCMMQSNVDFIPNFSFRSAELHKLTKSNGRFKWTAEHQKCFEELVDAFRKDDLVQYCDTGNPLSFLQTFTLVDWERLWH